MGKRAENYLKPGLICTALPSAIIRLVASVGKYFICYNTFVIILFIFQLMAIQPLCQ